MNTEIEESELIPTEKLSPAEQKFEIWRKRLGFFLAPAAFLAIYFSSIALPYESKTLAAVIVGVVLLWLCESIPMPITAVLGASLAVLLGVAPAKDVFAPFADPLMFLFAGSFMIARAIFIHGLDKRFAYGVLSWRIIDARPSRILFAFGAVTAFLSAWISNTATTAMMFAIGMSILSFLFSQKDESGKTIGIGYATAMMLMTSFAASIGGLATPIGTPPNIIGIGFLKKAGIEVTFFEWMVIGVPVVILLFLFLFTYLNILSPSRVNRINGAAAMIADERRKLGAWTTAQKSTLIAALSAVVFWVTPGVIALLFGERSSEYLFLNSRLPEGVAALMAVVLLFLLPGNEKGERALSWEEAVKIDWGIIPLYGGGFALGVLALNTGLAQAAGEGLTALIPFSGETGLIIAGVIVALIISEISSNTASANMVVPVVIAIAQAQGINPFVPALAATMASSLGFMLPVSTPCNAIVYGSGYIPIMKMVRYGFLLDLFGAASIITAMLILSWSIG